MNVCILVMKTAGLCETTSVVAVALIHKIQEEAPIYFAFKTANRLQR